jgi:hypothetical protein
MRRVTTVVASNGIRRSFTTSPAENRLGDPYGEENRTSSRCHPGVTVNRSGGVALSCRHRRHPRPVEHEFGGRGLASVDVERGPSGGVNVPLAVPAHRKRQALAIGFCRLGDDEPADVVEEGEREIQTARRKIEPAVDARDDARPVLGADFDRTSRLRRRRNTEREILAPARTR